jgi:hypothetical protein
MQNAKVFDARMSLRFILHFSVVNTYRHLAQLFGCVRCVLPLPHMHATQPVYLENFWQGNRWLKRAQEVLLCGERALLKLLSSATTCYIFRAAASGNAL